MESQILILFDNFDIYWKTSAVRFSNATNILPCECCRWSSGLPFVWYVKLDGQPPNLLKPFLLTEVNSDEHENAIISLVARET